MRRALLLLLLALWLGACGGAEAEPEPASESEAAPEAVAEARRATPPQAEDPPEGEPEARAEDEPEQAAEASDSPCGAVPEGMSCIPGGSYVRGRDDGPDNESPAAEVSVSTFLLDRLEVSNARYAECVEARECQRQMHFPGYMGAQQPAVAMRWDDADAYCRWRGGRLPTEAEWERAARGPGSGLYPWGDEPGEGCDRAIVLTDEGRGCGGEVTYAVGSRAAGPYGLHDMAGNVWEWVSDHHAFCYRGCRRECGEACEGQDPQGPCGDSHAECPASLGHRTVRGGSWWYRIDRATTTARRGVPGINPNPHRFGFRCARDV